METNHLNEIINSDKSFKIILHSCNEKKICEQTCFSYSIVIFDIRIPAFAIYQKSKPFFYFSISLHILTRIDIGTSPTFTTITQQCIHRVCLLCHRQLHFIFSLFYLLEGKKSQTHFIYINNVVYHMPSCCFENKLHNLALMYV